MRLLRAIPALPVKHIGRSVAFYRDKLGFAPRHEADGFAILGRDAVELHLWAAADEQWRTRAGPSAVVSGAESFIAGTASCRVAVVGVDELYRSLEHRGILHPNAHLVIKPWGTGEFGVLDLDRNLITFFEENEPRSA